MRKLILVLGVLVLLAVLLTGYLVTTTPKTASSLRVPLTAAQRALLSHVPASADAFALIPSAALVYRRLAANPVTAHSLLRWEEEHELPRPWMLGGADAVAWKREKTTSYAVRLDPVRALLVRAWMLVGSGAAVRWEGSLLVINDSGPEAPPADLDELLRLAAGLPAGEAFVVQRHRAKGAFPPIGRPAVTSVRLSASDILLVSRAVAEDAPVPAPVLARFPKSALLSVTFARPPRMVGDLNRLLGMRLEELVRGGGSIVLYDVDTGTLLPRPRGLVVIPATDETRAALDDVARVAELVGETADTGQELQLSFDRTSLGLYSKDMQEPASWPATRWAVRMDPQRLVPILHSLSKSRGLRFLTPGVHRGARDLEKWIGAVEGARSIEAGSSVTDGIEELRVRIAAK